MDLPDRFPPIEADPASPVAVETFWPPSPQEASRWRWRMGFLFLVTLAAVGTLPALGAVLYRLATATFDLAAHMESLAFPVAVVGSVGFVLLLVVPRVSYWDIGRRITRGRVLAEGVLGEGETLRALCPVMFLDGVFRAGFLLLTDRRIVRLENTVSGSRHATLSRWEDLSSVDITTRRANRNPIAGAFLRYMQVGKGLTLTTEAGQSFFLTTDALFLRPLADFIRESGHEIGFRNDEDLAERAELTPVEFQVRLDPSRRRRNMLRLGLILLLFFLSVAWLLGVALT